MAKGKRSNSPKRSRRGGKRSPKKSKMGVEKKINKNEAKPAQLHFESKDVEEPDCECELPNEGEELPKIPSPAKEVPVADITTFKTDLVQFFWDSLDENERESLKTVSQLDEQLFFFGKVAAEITKTGKFTSEVESNLAAVWKSDEAWIRSFLASEVELPKPEPEEPVEEPAEIVEEVAEVEAESKMEVEVAAEVVAEAPETEVVEPAEITTEEKPEVEDIAMEGVIEEPAAEAPEAFENPAAAGGFVVHVEPALNKENSENVIAEAVKTVSSKLGEQSMDSAVEAKLEGLAPKDLNVVQPSDLA